MKLTAVFEKVPEGYIGYVLEFPGANTQGFTLAETKRNLRQAVRLVSRENSRLSRPKRRAGIFKEIWTNPV